MTIWRLWAWAVVGMAAVSSGDAVAEAVDLELVIATDVSRSIDPDEALLQREGVVAAFRSPEVIAAIKSGFLGKIAVAYIDYSSRLFNEVVIDWQVIKDKASAAHFTKRLLDAPLSEGRRTSISDAVEQAAQMIEENNFEGTRRVIDVAGDGPNNHGRLVSDVRNDTIAKRITINGLPIVDNQRGPGGRFHLPDLDKYYRGCVIGGIGAFYLVAKDFNDFASAFRKKLIFEIAGISPTVDWAGSTRYHPALVKVSTHRASPTGYVYEKGCDIGERMWERIWGDGFDTN